MTDSSPAQTASNSPSPEPPPSAPMPPPAPPQNVPAPPPPPPPPPEPPTKQVSGPVGTQVYVRMIDYIESDKAHAGDSFHASLDRPIVVDNLTIVPKNVDVSLRLDDVQSAGKLSGTSQLKVRLEKIFINKKPYDVVTNTYSQSGASEGQKAARNVGVGAAVGGILGGILGGGKGAVIGAGAGGGGGAAVSKGQQIRIDSETQLVFKLENPLEVTINLIPSQGSTKSASAGGPNMLNPPPDSPPILQRSSPSAADSNSLSGSWTVGTDALLPATMRLVLRQNGNNLQGSISNPRGGGGTVPIQGSINGNYITFSTLQQSGYGAQPPPIQFSGAINGDTIDGTFPRCPPHPTAATAAVFPAVAAARQAKLARASRRIGTPRETISFANRMR